MIPTLVEPPSSRDGRRPLVLLGCNGSWEHEGAFDHGGMPNLYDVVSLCGIWPFWRHWDLRRRTETLNDEIPATERGMIKWCRVMVPLRFVQSRHFVVSSDQK
jgi:hypothetical protein